VWQAPVNNPSNTTSTLTIPDNTLVRGDGGGRGVQTSTISVDDLGNMSGVVQLNVDDVVAVGDVSAATGTITTLDSTTFTATTINVAGGSWSGGALNNRFTNSN
jgi:hypothetical protein